MRQLLPLLQRALGRCSLEPLCHRTGNDAIGSLHLLEAELLQPFLVCCDASTSGRRRRRDRRLAATRCRRRRRRPRRRLTTLPHHGRWSTAAEWRWEHHSQSGRQYKNSSAAKVSPAVVKKLNRRRRLAAVGILQLKTARKSTENGSRVGWRKRRSVSARSASVVTGVVYCTGPRTTRKSKTLPQRLLRMCLRASQCRHDVSISPYYLIYPPAPRVDSRVRSRRRRRW